MSKKLVILGAGGYANTVKDVSEQLGYDVIAMLDDRFADRTLDSFTKYIADDTEFIPAFGNNEFRLSWCDKITRADRGPWLCDRTGLSYLPWSNSKRRK